MSLKNFDHADVADMFSYLDELRASGEVNMFGARPYLADEYALESREAGNVLSAWMETFSGDTAEQRAIIALDGDAS